MSSSLVEFIYRLFFSFLIFSIAPAASAVGEGSHCDPDYVPVVDWPSPCQFELSNFGGHCDVENNVEPDYEIMTTVIVGLGTHDTVMLPSLAAARIAGTDSQQSADGPLAESESETVAVTAAVLSFAGVKVQQVVEPFALVGTDQGKQLMQVRVASVDQFLSWWSSLVADSRTAKHAAVDSPTSGLVEMHSRIETLALAEPIDTNAMGGEPVWDAIEIARLDPLAGSGPMIATIEEVYLPYDPAPSDLKLWDCYATVEDPFCVGDRLQSQTDALQWSDPDTELASAEVAKWFQWMNDAGKAVMKLANELKRERLAAAQKETQSL